MKHCLTRPAAALKILPGMLFVLAFAASAPAHPGHGLAEQGAWHAVTSPDHAAVLAVAGFGMWLGARFIQRRLARQAVQWTGAAAMLAAVLLLGVRV